MAPCLFQRLWFNLHGGWYLDKNIILLHMLSNIKTFVVDQLMKKNEQSTGYGTKWVLKSECATCIFRNSEWRATGGGSYWRTFTLYIAKSECYANAQNWKALIRYLRGAAASLLPPPIVKAVHVHLAVYPILVDSYWFLSGYIAGWQTKI